MKKTPPRTATPPAAVQDVNPSLNSSVQEIESKLKELELKFLGKEFPVGAASPFTPLSTLQKRVQHFKASLQNVSSESVQSKLPPVTLPTFDGSDLESFLKDFERWLRLSGVDKCSESFQLDWLIQAASPKVKRIVERVVEEEGNLEKVLESLAELFPRLENDITLRDALDRIPQLSPTPEPAQVKKLFIDFEEIISKMSVDGLGKQEKLILLTKKVQPKTFQELRADRHYKRRTENFDDLKVALLEKAQEDWLERHLFLQKKQVLNTLQEPFPSAVSQNSNQGKGSSTQSQGKSQSQSQSQNRGKGKGKGQPQGKGKGKGANPSNESQPPRFSVTVFCKFCNKKGHYEDQCWSKQREEKKKKGTAQVQTPSVPHQSSTPDQSSDASSKKRKVEAIHVMQGKTLSTEVHVNGTSLVAIIDSGATTSAISKKCVPESAILRNKVIPIQVGNGETIFSEGTAELTLQFSDTILKQTALVVPTTAFQAVLGMDFLSNPRVGGLLTQPPPCKLLVDGSLIPLKETGASQIHRLFRLFKKESYSLISDVRSEVLQKLGVDSSKVIIDLFANRKNFQECLYCTRQNSAWKYDWEKLLENPEHFLWANPPFSQLSRVLTKVALEPLRMILVTPDWSEVYWRRLLEKLSVAQVSIPQGVSLYKSDWAEKPLPTPQWSTLVSLVDSKKISVNRAELDPSVVRWLQKANLSWGKAELEHEVRKYPKFSADEEMERETQTDIPFSVSSNVSSLPPTPPLSPILPLQKFYMSLQEGKRDQEVLFQANLFSEVDLSFTMTDFQSQEKG